MASIGVIDAVLFNTLVADRCPKCNHMAEIDLSIKQKVFILGIPWFPLSKTSKVSCGHCKQSMPIIEAPQFVKNRFDEEIEKAKPRIWSFSGLILIGVLFVFGLFYVPHLEKKHKKLINNPKIGDVYVIEYDEAYSLLHLQTYRPYKVMAISDGAIMCYKALYEVGDIRDLNEILDIPDDELWADETASFTRQELLKMLDITAPTQIHEINREEEADSSEE